MPETAILLPKSIGGIKGARRAQGRAEGCKGGQEGRQGGQEGRSALLFWPSWNTAVGNTIIICCTIVCCANSWLPYIQLQIHVAVNRIFFLLIMEVCVHKDFYHLLANMGTKQQLYLAKQDLVLSIHYLS